MKRVNRREFAKIVGEVALLVPFAETVGWPQEAAKKPEQPAKSAADQPTEAPKPEPPTKSGQAPFKLTPKQEEALQKALERRDRQLAPLRSRNLPYDAEPAFVFRVRQRPRSARKPG